MEAGIGTESIELVLFTPIINLADKIKVVNKLNEMKSVSFNSDPTILTISQDAPPEIPHIVLRTKNNDVLLNISPLRTDLFMNTIESSKLGVPKKKLTDLDTLATKRIDEIYDVLNTNFSAKVKRVAVIVRHIVKFDKSSKDFILSQIIKEKIDKPSEIKIAYLYKEKLGSFEINKWRRFETLRHKKNKKDDTAASLTYDINTVPETVYDFDNKKIHNFVESAFSIIKRETKTFFNKK